MAPFVKEPTRLIKRPLSIRTGPTIAAPPKAPTKMFLSGPNLFIISKKPENIFMAFVAHLVNCSPSGSNSDLNVCIARLYLPVTLFACFSSSFADKAANCVDEAIASWNT